MASSTNRKPILGTALGIAAVISGSPTFVLVRVLRIHNAFQQLILRSIFFLGVAVFFALLRWFRPHGLTKLHKAIQSLGVRGMVGCLFLAVQSIAIVVSLLLTRMSNVAFIINTSPVFCALSDRFLLNEPFKSHTIVMIVMGLISVGIIVGGDFDGDTSLMLGNVIALLNPISWTIFWAVVRKRSGEKKTDQVNDAASSLELELNVQVEIVDKENEPIQLKQQCIQDSKWDDLLLYQIGSGIFAAVAGGIGIGCGAKWKDPNENPTDWLWYFMYGGIILPLCVGLFSAAPMYISTTEMGILKMMEMVLIPIYGYYYEGEVPTTAAYIGGSLLIVTLSIHAYFTIREQREKIGKGGNGGNSGKGGKGGSKDAQMVKIKT